MKAGAAESDYYIDSSVSHSSRIISQRGSISKEPNQGAFFNLPNPSLDESGISPHEKKLMGLSQEETSEQQAAVKRSVESIHIPLKSRDTFGPVNMNKHLENKSDEVTFENADPSYLVSARVE